MCGGGEYGSELCLFQRGGVHICMCVGGGRVNHTLYVCSLSMCGLGCGVVCMCVCEKKEGESKRLSEIA